MLIFDEHNQPTILDSIHSPTVAEYMWVLNLQESDFMLAPITMLEETVCPSVMLLVNGFEFILPAHWFILVYDYESTVIDVVELSEAAGREFTAVMYGPTRSRAEPATITVTNYFAEHRNVGPLLNKHQMLCHPVGPNEWISVSPSDSYNKYLKDKCVGDLLL